LPTVDTPNVQEDVTEDDHSAHSSEWSFNLGNVLDEDQDDPIMNEIINDTEGNTNETPAADTIASNRPRRENAGMGVERPDIGI
jgi:hypothetical protein